MLEECVSLGSREYFAFLSVLLFSRGVDFLSTWIATPNLLLEANPVARRLGWRWGLLVNLGLCLGFALWPLTAVIIGTTSVLVASRNFQLAWLMRSQGEENYRAWMVQRVMETPPGLFLFCLLAQTILIGAVGAGLMYFSGFQETVTLGIGMGIVGYAVAVLVYNILGLCRHRRMLRNH